jgi:hypothetical protein
MNYYEIIGEFINRLQFILFENAPELDPNIVNNIKAEAHDALYEILVKYDLIKP